MKYCNHPWTSLVINPGTGHLHECCVIMDRAHLDLKIQDVDDLKDTFDNHPNWKNCRKNHLKKGWENLNQCWDCNTAKKHLYPTQHHMVPRSWKFPIAKGLQYLELTTSNTCNQNCVTCSSMFSSKWRKIEHLYDREQYKSWSLSKKDIEKVLKVLPHLRVIQFKGGEFFADMNNLKILNELYEVNNNCIIEIVSNFHEIPEKFMTAIEKYGPDKIHINASIDGIGKVYEWIRSSSWEKTLNTLRQYYSMSNNQIKLVPTISYYNMKHIPELIKWSEQEKSVFSLKDTPIEAYNRVISPLWCAIDKLYTQDELDKWGFGYLKSNIDEKTVALNKKYTEVTNKLRGFSIE
tara:strand:- start:2658 stop:3704 length:1047 start_codon:yes stop_codon:yes gene_type:complete